MSYQLGGISMPWIHALFQVQRPGNVDKDSLINYLLGIAKNMELIFVTWHS
jgi:hypothetical protein